MSEALTLHFDGASIRGIRIKGVGMSVIAETEKAWAAGFVDGEGCIAISRRGRKDRPTVEVYRPYISVSNTRRPPLEFLSSIWGGLILDLVKYFTPAQMKRQRPSFEWRLREGEMTKFLTDIRPYLRLKGPQADLVLEFITTKNAFSRLPRPRTRGGSAPMSHEERAGRERLFWCCRKLNAKGPQANVPDSAL